MDTEFLVMYRMFLNKDNMPGQMNECKMEMVPNESSAALLPPEETVPVPVLVDRPRTMSAPLESEEYVTFEAKLNGENVNCSATIRHKSVSIRDASSGRVTHAPVIYPR